MNRFRIKVVPWGHYSPSFTLQTDGRLVDDKERNQYDDALFGDNEAEIVRSTIVMNTRYTNDEVFIDAAMKEEER